VKRLAALTPETASGASGQMLADLVQRHGQVGEMASTMANSPAVLSGYLELNRAMKRAKLSRRISERISIAVQVRQGCERCLQAHIAAARSLGIDDDEIERARRGTSSDPATAAIIGLALRVYEEPTAITDEEIASLRQLGFRDREISDVVGVVALNVLTGAFNLVAGLDPTG
jgi:AhpD family alkylhydroperoxidase